MKKKYLGSNYWTLFNPSTRSYSLLLPFSQRVDLFNAYAMTAMCRAGFLVLDVYPLTSSYPSGTLDGVHYNNTVFASAEDILENYFRT